MSEQVRRGYFDSDETDFNEKNLVRLRKAQKDFYYLMNQDYPMQSIATFVGNHFAFSERQRMALIRATSSEKSLVSRAQKEIKTLSENETVYIDGFNIIITLEVALSDSTLLHCMDGTIRDLAGLRGTYRLIDKTQTAIDIIGQKLCKMKIKKCVFFLDKPVSNSGQLKAKIFEVLEKYDFETDVQIVNDADQALVSLENVISSDAMVIERSASWINLVKSISDESEKPFRFYDFTMASSAQLNTHKHIVI